MMKLYLLRRAVGNSARGGIWLDAWTSSVWIGNGRLAGYTAAVVVSMRLSNVSNVESFSILCRDVAETSK